MRAAIYRRSGAAKDVLSVEEIDRPEPGPGEVRVKIALSGVNPTDWKSRSGMTGGEPAGFQVPHHDGVGVIDATGPGVAETMLGARVWLSLAAAGNRYGTAAQYAVVPQDRARVLPDSASDELGTALGVPAVTAAHALGGDPSVLRGARVLVPGGAGAVGHFAIELAKWAGAVVATTVSSDEKADLARAAGADLVVNYRQPSALSELRSFAPSFDRIIEVAIGANLGIDLALSGPRTVISVYASEANDPVIPTRALMGANVTLRYLLLYGVPRDELEAARAFVAGALAAGALSELTVYRYPLEEIAAAHDAVEHGAIGKVAVVPD
jgi:NADPH2:quinone reductase